MKMVYALFGRVRNAAKGEHQKTSKVDVGYQNSKAKALDSKIPKLKRWTEILIQS
jgi:hypothetical protein